MRSILTALTFLSLAVGPKAQAVSPPPDGGYPNFTTAEGTRALFSLTTGAANTAVGWYSLFSDTQGSFNTATGAGALLFNTADTNTAFGAAALLFNVPRPGIHLRAKRSMGRLTPIGRACLRRHAHRFGLDQAVTFLQSSLGLERFDLG